MRARSISGSIGKASKPGGSMKIRLAAVVLAASAPLAGCSGGGGGSSPPPPPVVVTNHTVTLSWAPNHEKGVNSTGGGYHVSISGHAPIDVPFTAPTSITTILQTGTYTVTVTAFAALDAQGSTTGAGSVSAPSQSLIVNVP